MDQIIRGALVVTETGPEHLDVGIGGGQILALARPGRLGGAPVLDAAGLVLLPGLVDMHVHVNEPGRDWEGFACASQAAAAGGVTTFVDMPLNATPPTIDAGQFRRKAAAAAGQCLVDYAFWGGLVEDNVAEMAGLHACGVTGFKAFMSESGVDFARTDDGVLLAGLLEAARLGQLVAVHAESEAITAYLRRQLQAAGRSDWRAHLEHRPPHAELEAIRRALYLAGVAGARLHIVHCTLAAGVQEVLAARRRGQAVSVETCPHYLALTDADFLALGPVAKCAPPLRSRAEVEALWAAVLAGHVDVIASDHSPCPTAAKEAGRENIWQAWGGISGLQTMLPVLLDAGVHQRGMDLGLLARLVATNPARLTGLYPRKGAIRIGADADLVLVDLDGVTEVTAGWLRSRHPHSPWLGRQLRGAVVCTLVRGVLVYDRGAITGEPGTGRLVRPGGRPGQ